MYEPLDPMPPNLVSARIFDQFVGCVWGKSSLPGHQRQHPRLGRGQSTRHDNSRSTTTRKRRQETADFETVHEQKVLPVLATRNFRSAFREGNV